MADESDYVKTSILSVHQNADASDKRGVLRY